MQLSQVSESSNGVHNVGKRWLILDARYPRSKAYEERKSSIHTSVAEAAGASNMEDNLCKF